MKKIAFAIILCAVLGSFSCKKSSSSNPATQPAAISATIDGKTQTFNANLYCKIQSFNGFQLISISAAQGTTANDYVFMLVAAPASGNIKTGTYSGSIAPGAGTGDGASVSYSQQSLATVYSNDPTVSTSNATIVITSLTSTHVKGTFNGVLSLENTNGGTLKTISNGTFDMDIK